MRLPLNKHSKIKKTYQECCLEANTMGLVATQLGQLPRTAKEGVPGSNAAGGAIKVRYAKLIRPECSERSRRTACSLVPVHIGGDPTVMVTCGVGTWNSRFLCGDLFPKKKSSSSQRTFSRSHTKNSQVQVSAIFPGRTLWKSVTFSSW